MMKDTTEVDLTTSRLRTVQNLFVIVVHLDTFQDFLIA